MWHNKLTKTVVAGVVAPLLVSSLSTSGTALAGYTVGAPAKMLSQGPCYYSVQLQKSVPERKRYLVKLSEATGGEVSVASQVEDMYSDIQKASYSDGASDGDPWGLGAKSVAATPGLDSFSTECISCHDGSSAVAIGANLRNEPFNRGHKKYSASDHPVGMDYQSYVGANPRKYKSVFGNSKMVFINGKVGCLTCHDPLNPERKHLVMSDRRSALCLSCHDT